MIRPPPTSTATDTLLPCTTLFRSKLRASDAHAAPVGCRELTRGEKEGLGLLFEGGDDAAIAKDMGVSRNTLRNHIARVYQKIGVNRRAAAILWARERGFPLTRPLR